jgi:hypothetical protein
MVTAILALLVKQGLQTQAVEVAVVLQQEQVAQEALAS